MLKKGFLTIVHNNGFPYYALIMSFNDKEVQVRPLTSYSGMCKTIPLDQLTRWGYYSEEKGWYQ